MQFLVISARFGVSCLYKLVYLSRKDYVNLCLSAGWVRFLLSIGQVRLAFPGPKHSPNAQLYLERHHPVCRLPHSIYNYNISNNKHYERKNFNFALPPCIAWGG